MELRFGRNTYELNSKDIVLHNGNGYMLISRKEVVAGVKSFPTINEARMEELIEEGKFKKVILENPPFKGKSMKYYMLTEQNAILRRRNDTCGLVACTLIRFKVTLFLRNGMKMDGKNSIIKCMN